MAVAQKMQVRGRDNLRHRSGREPPGAVAPSCSVRTTHDPPTKCVNALTTLHVCVLAALIA
jgi:hypothetical protein